MSTVLGLDIGSNSVGWALVDIENQSITAMGVRIFPDAVENKNSEREESKNVARRMKRQLRKQYDRRRRRAKVVRSIMVKNALLPLTEEELDRLNTSDPYELRSRSLTEKLELYEIGKIIDHINSRRGFQSNRKSSSEEETSGVIIDGTKDGLKPGIMAIDESLNPKLRKYKDYLAEKASIVKKLPDVKHGYRTMGEYLYSLDPHTVRRRNRFTLRDHYRIELDLILALQARYYPKVLTPELQEQILGSVFHQRPLKSVRHLVGKCRFEPGKKRVHKSHPEYQRFRFLQQVNALRVNTTDRVSGDDTDLLPEEIYNLKLIAEAAAAKGRDRKLKLETQGDIKKALGWKSKIPATASVTSVDLERTIADMRNALGRTYIDGLPREQVHELWNVLQYAEDLDWVIDWAQKKLGVDETKARAFAAIKLEDGYGSVSLRAVRKILPFLEEGDLYNEAVVHAGYNFHDEALDFQITDRVPALLPEDARNSMVQRSFAETRRIVNAIVRKWGNPDVIRVEMGRDLKLPAKQRAKIEKENKKNQTQNANDKTRLEKEFKIDDARRSDILKLRLWEEQDGKCMYTGKTIAKNMLFNGTVDVDHILPYSRTLDDSKNNKVVCLREVNQAKGNRTPWEAAMAGVLDFEALKEMAKILRANHKITDKKHANLLMSAEQFAERFSDDPNNGFIARQLNDTRFATRLVSKYLRTVTKRVEAPTGAMTAMLRRFWGLDGVLPELASLGRAFVAPVLEGGRKDRNDHRHHAVDALTIALTNQSIIQKISTLNARSEEKSKELRDGKIKLPDAPIAGLRKLALDCVDSIIVSHRKTRKGRGALHQETLYGLARTHGGEQRFNAAGVPQYVVRKPLSAGLSCGEIDGIVNPVVRNLVLQRLEEFGVNTSQKKYTIPEDAFAAPLYYELASGERRRIKRVRILVPSTSAVKLRKDGVYVIPFGSDHMLFYRENDSQKYKWELRSRLDLAKKLPLQKLTLSEAEQAISLRAGDLVELTRKGKIDVYKVQKLSGAGVGEVSLFHHADASGNTKQYERPTPSAMQFEKLTVDILGNITPE